MPSVRYYNSTAPFWDFIADMENNGLGQNRNGGEAPDNEDRPNPWAQGWSGMPWGQFAHRGRHTHGYSHGHGHGAFPAPPPHHDGPPPPTPPHPTAEDGESDPEAGPSDPRGPPPPFSDDEQQSGEGRTDRRDRHGRHGSHRGPGARGGPCGAGRGRGGWGGRGRGHWQPYAQMAGPFGAWAEMFQNQLFGNESNTRDNKNGDFKPDVDVFDTADAFIVHAALAGAKKEDVGVNWDADKSELSIAGVVHRPGDEEFLKTLALDERKIGAFERKVRLGSRANPAQVDVDGITARMEDGVLTVEVPKLDSGYVEVKKVDIE